jgi:hypothetical protein
MTAALSVLRGELVNLRCYSGLVVTDRPSFVTYSLRNNLWRVFLKRFALLCLLLVALPSFADSFTYDDFSDITGLSFNGYAHQNGNAIQLSPDNFFSSGGALYGSRVEVLDGFAMSFDFQIIHRPWGSTIGDGIWLQVFNDWTHSFWVEFDTYQNSWDPNANHVAFIGCSGISVAIVTDHSNGCTLEINPGIGSQLANNGVHYATLTYHAKDMTLVLDGQTVLDTIVDLGTQVGNSDGRAWVGINGWTAVATEENDLLSWSFQSASPVPEPSTIVMMAPSFLGLLAVKRKMEK